VSACLLDPQQIVLASFTSLFPLMLNSLYLWQIFSTGLVDGTLSVIIKSIY